MSIVSGVVALAGALAARAALRHLARASAMLDPHAAWAVGLAGLTPGWLVAFLGLLGTRAGAPPAPEIVIPWILSAAAALGGAIVTETLVRRASETAEGRPPATFWWLGLLALGPAWAIALAGHLAGLARG